MPTEFTGINLMVPTYQRVKNGKLPRHVQSFIKHVSDVRNICYTFLVNRGDEESLEYLRTTEDITCRMEVMQTVESKPHLGKFYNQMYRDSHWANESGYLVSMVGDDMVCETQNWDVKILEAANRLNGMGIIHCEDGIQNGRIAVNLFTTRKWIEATGGEFMCESFRADYIDVIHSKIAGETKREAFLPDVMLRHEHSSLQAPEARDATFNRLREEWDDDNAEAIVVAYVNSRLMNLYAYMDKQK